MGRGVVCDVQRKNTVELAKRYQDRQMQRKDRFLRDPARLENVHPDMWTVSDVLNWLSRVNLGQLKEVFDQHEVDGIKLQTLNKQNLDEMGIRALGLRKRLAMELKRIGGSQAPTRQESQKVHWSQIKPLCETEPVSPAPLPVNLADGSFDEAKAHDEFQKAVLEWRLSVNQEEQQEPDKPLPITLLNNEVEGDDGMWHNPF